MNPVKVNVKPAGTPDSQLNQDFVYSANGTDKELPASEIYCHRQQKIVRDGNVVKILVHKSSLTNMSKIIETIPNGYTVQNIDDKGAIFNVEGNTVKYMWMNLPLEQEFTISYKLYPIENAPIERVTINGNFSYSHNNITKTVKIENKDFEQTSKVLADVTTPTAPPVTPVVQVPPVVQAPPVVTKPVVTEILSQASVTYRIQIAASHKLVNVKKFFKKFKVTDQVIVDQHEGWNKYLIAGFGEYKTARDYRQQIWTETDVHDAFVAAYNNGQRITVQEALMISNQQWFK